MKLFSRRSFLQWTGLSAVATACNQPSGAVRKPLVVSTWNSGTTANTAAWRILSTGGAALDAVEQAGIAIEDVQSCCVGLGGNPDRDGFVTLDACIMDEKANIGSVAFLERIKHPVSVARKVMETTPHVMLVGSGALQFALASGFPLEPGTLSQEARKAYDKWLEKAEYKPIINIENLSTGEAVGPPPPTKLENGAFNHDTMGTLALDASGNLSGMCTTSGMGFKMRGRVGDSPIIGAGLFVDNEVGAVTCSGQGEEVIRLAGSAIVVEFMRNGDTPHQACKRAIERIVKRDEVRAQAFQVGFIAINKRGEVGAYAVQPGFNYTVTAEGEENKFLDAESYFKKS
jgi:N4-(beta-N-acetylglucosaminyl)-L-asparaginase